MRKEIFCMKRFVNGILMLLWAAATVMAQAPTSRVATSYGTVTVPGFLPPAIGQADPVAYWASNLGLDAGHLPLEQQIGLRVYEPILGDAALIGGKLVNMPKGPDGSPAPLATFLAEETALLRQRRVTLSESQPSLDDRCPHRKIWRDLRPSSHLQVFHGQVICGTLRVKNLRRQGRDKYLNAFISTHWRSKRRFQASPVVYDGVERGCARRFILCKVRTVSKKK